MTLQRRALFLAPALGGGLVWLGLGLAHAQLRAVQLAGVSGDRALLVVDNLPPKFLLPGESHANVRLLQVTPGGAKVAINGQTHTLVLGESPVSVGTPAASGTTDNQRVVLTADSRGHFLSVGSINGKSVQFLVDTGATHVVLGQADAQRLGLKTDGGQRVGMQTANGTVVGHQLKLQRVRLGDVEVNEVTAVVLPQHMPYALLGNSFLMRFQMQRHSDQMTLQRRY